MSDGASLFERCAERASREGVTPDDELAMQAILQDELTLARRKRGPQAPKKFPFDRSHGSLYDRGDADRHYGREQEPHYGGVGGTSGPRVAVTDPDSVAEYRAGYRSNILD